MTGQLPRHLKGKLFIVLGNSNNPATEEFFGLKSRKILGDGNALTILNVAKSRRFPWI